jgi:hypothetical protein
VKTIAASVALLCVAAVTHLSEAIAADGGSTYSLYGIGDLRYMTSTRSTSMGYTGIALPGVTSINNLSPATWSSVSQVRLDAGFLYEGFKSSDASKSIFLGNANFYGALLAIPISPAHGVVFVGGFTPYSTINYSLFTKGIQEGIDYTIHHQGSGGVGVAQAGLSYAPSTDLSLGVSFNYLVGSIDNSRTLASTNTSFVGGTVTENQTLHGITYTLGALFKGFGSFSEPLRPLCLGFFITSRGNLATTRQSLYEFSDALRDSSSETPGRIAVPFSYGVGLGYQAGERYIFAADYFAQPWRDADFDGADLPEIRNSYRIGVGGEILPARDPNATWLNRLSYRLGFFYHATYYQINNEPINEWGVTGGLGLPMSRDTRLTVGLEYSTRGTTNNSLVKDNIVRLSLSLNIGEIWFARYEED